MSKWAAKIILITFGALLALLWISVIVVSMAATMGYVQAIAIMFGALSVIGVVGWAFVVLVNG